MSLGGASTSAETSTPKVTPKKTKVNGDGRASGAGGATENPTTPTLTAKKAKAKTPKSTIKVEETTDTNGAGDADNEDSAVPTVDSTVTPTKKRSRGPNKPKHDEHGNVILPKKRMSAAQKAAQKAVDEAAEAAAAAAKAEAEQTQKETDALVTRLLTAQADGIGYAAYEGAVSDAEILHEDGDHADVEGEESADGEEHHEMTQSEQDEKLFDTSVYENDGTAHTAEGNPVDAEEA